MNKTNNEQRYIEYDPKEIEKQFNLGEDVDLAYVDKLNPYVDAMDDKFLYSDLNSEEKQLVLTGQLIHTFSCAGIDIKLEAIKSVSYQLMNSGLAHAYVHSIKKMIGAMQLSKDALHELQNDFEKLKIDLSKIQIIDKKYPIPTQAEINEQRFRKDQDNLRRKYSSRWKR